MDVVLDNPSESPTLPSRGVGTVTVTAGQSSTQNFGVFVFGGGAPVAPTPANLYGTDNVDPNVAYVRGLYQTLLGRDASRILVNGAGQSVSEAEYWTEQLDSGALTRQQVAYDIVNSTEHRLDEVNYFYQTILGRSAAGDAGALFWVDQLQAGVSEATVMQGIFNSPEFQSAHPDAGSFADTVYLEVLGRLPSAAELSAVENLLSNGGTRSGEEGIVITSPESAGLQVAGFYSAFFHEPATGDSGWVSLLESGVSAGLVEALILSDPTYQQFYQDGAATVS